MSLYEDLGTEEDEDEETAGTQVVRTQWLDFGNLQSGNLIGKNVLIVDEVDDTRTTLHYAVSELEKDVQEQAAKLGMSDAGTKFFIFVLHNKDKEKRADLPNNMVEKGLYLAARTVPDSWIAYPWESVDIETHTEEAVKQGNN